MESKNEFLDGTLTLTWRKDTLKKPTIGKGTHSTAIKLELWMTGIFPEKHDQYYCYAILIAYPEEPSSIRVIEYVKNNFNILNDLSGDDTLICILTESLSERINIWYNGLNIGKSSSNLFETTKLKNDMIKKGVRVRIPSLIVCESLDYGPVMVVPLGGLSLEKIGEVISTLFLEISSYISKHKPKKRSGKIIKHMQATKLIKNIGSILISKLNLKDLKGIPLEDILKLAK